MTLGRTVDDPHAALAEDRANLVVADTFGVFAVRGSLRLAAGPIGLPREIVNGLPRPGALGHRAVDRHDRRFVLGEELLDLTPERIIPRAGPIQEGRALCEWQLAGREEELTDPIVARRFQWGLPVAVLAGPGGLPGRRTPEDSLGDHIAAILMGVMPDPPDDRSETAEALQHASERSLGPNPELAERIYVELRRIASSFLARERADHTLQPTALVHEAWMRVAGEDGPVENQAHFRALASTAMRRILVDHARAKQTTKRGGSAERVTLSAVGERPSGTSSQEADASGVEVLALDAALTKLAQVSARQAQVVEMRFFGELSIEEVAQTLDISPRTVQGDWRVARAWLSRELERED